ncbi:hypothetical protein LSTR_LSTR009807 [Laodelphax striatellus]|uniref:Uncharacterized protein n=1 Tax=Laodelphax striatellus TaxID=195883 RepID=A0A482XN15_LAOST|nr:hypothetical protein LSTR_LSTR009807 [Laodelphax striatellus]
MCKIKVDSLELGINSASSSGEISPHSFSGEEHTAVDAQELYDSLQALSDSHRKFVSLHNDDKEEEEDGVILENFKEFGDEEKGMMDNPVTITGGNKPNQVQTFRHITRPKAFTKQKMLGHPGASDFTLTLHLQLWGSRKGSFCLILTAVERHML